MTEPDAALVRRLIDVQFPQYQDLPLTPLPQSGWDNRTFRLGEYSVRLPSAAAYANQVHKEARWLPYLAPHIEVVLPEIVALGEPSEEYAWPWSIRQWIEGETLLQHAGDLAGEPRVARAVADMLLELHDIDCRDGPSAGAQNFHRGGALAVYDAQCRMAIDKLRHRDPEAAARCEVIWADALIDAGSSAPVWVHGDLSADNLLVRANDLCAVIDFGCLGVGDPACDLALMWTFFRGRARHTFQEVMGLDGATWCRARGWVLWKALIVATGMVETKQHETKHAPEVLRRVITDQV